MLRLRRAEIQRQLEEDRERMKMSPADYVADIGLTYLLMPSITIGFGHLMAGKRVGTTA